MSDRMIDGPKPPRGAVDRLRGPDGGYARSHAGLAEFWRCLHEDVLARSASEQDADLLTALDGWFAEGPSCALVVGADQKRRTEVLARWALSMAARDRAEVIFLPVSSCFGTAVEREALKVLLGLFRSSWSAAFSRPRSPNELRWSIAGALRWDLEMEDPVLLVIVDGLERAADWEPEKGVPFLDEAGFRVRFLVSVGVEGPSARSSDWRQHLEWTEETSAVLHLPGEATAAEEVVQQARDTLAGSGDEGRAAERCLDALATALAPISKDALIAAFGLSSASLEALHRAPRPARALVVHADDGTYRFRDDATRARWSASADIASLEDGIVARGLASLRAAGTAERAPLAWPAYLVEYLGAHMTRRAPALSAFMELVSPAWLAAWMDRPGGLVGFVTDARRARATAEEVLFNASTEPERAAALNAITRCAVVEGALFAKEGSRHGPRDDRAHPYKEPSVDLAKPTAAARARAVALVTLAGTLAGAEREAVEAWADEARAALGEAGELVPCPIPSFSGIPTATDPALTRQLRDAAPDKFGSLLSGPYHEAAAACAGLEPEEALRLAGSTDGVLRVTAFAAIVPHLPEALRERAVAEVMDAYWQHGDDDTLRSVLACAPWMALDDASCVLCDVLGNRWQKDFENLLIGWGGLTDFAPLLRRLGGSAAIVGAASAIAEVGRWLP
ncbi:hypothetical protein ACSRUE_27125 [Sorangium sp. KYC3313]|uniref:hypothetical protein n=1 Tax=Sorangium sp. KYC3313 TaxID=3449740 RepID=UPI003F896376